MKVIVLDNHDVQISRKEISCMYLKIKRASREVQVIAPRDLDDSIIERYVRSKEYWIDAHTSYSNNITPIPDVVVDDGGSIPLFGKDIPIKFRYVEKNPLYVQEENGHLVFYIKRHTDEERKDILVREWYRNKLEAEIDKYLKKWEKIMGVKVLDCRTKKMKTRWGTCNPDLGNLWINLELVKLPKKYLEFIMVHEMVHFFERGRGKAFKQKLKEFYPKWKEVKKEMKNYSIL